MKATWESSDGTARLHHGDCLEVMGEMAPSSVDAIVTDPPYGLEFMGKDWDRQVPGCAYWEAALRVAKPGAWMAAFGGTRTVHRLVCAIEDAGWEIRDMVMWVYGSGFPKSLNGPWGGTALKPAWEPICLARRPPAGTVGVNFERYGTGGLGIDSCRVEAGGDRLGGGRISTRTAGWDRPWKQDPEAVGACRKRGEDAVAKAEALGRWPSNVIHDGSEEVTALFPEQTSGANPTRRSAAKFKNAYGEFEGQANCVALRGAESGSAARFFYCAKATAEDRDDGLAGQRNAHPTVKPTTLMRYLCRLVTPRGGAVMDPFMGSGSTGKAAILEGLRFEGIDREAECVDVAKARIMAAMVDRDAELFR